MTGTELYASEDYIPSFTAACDAMNMLERKAGFVAPMTATSGGPVRTTTCGNPEAWA